MTASAGPRVLILTANVGGGTGNHLAALLRHWRGWGADVRVVSQRRPNARLDGTEPIHVLPPGAPYQRGPITHLATVRRLRRLLDDWSPHIVHAYFFWPILYGRWLKGAGAVARLIENREDQGFSWSRGDYALLRWTRAIPDRVICVAGAVREVALTREHLDPARVVVIRNGVECGLNAADGAAARADLDLAASDLVVGMVANFNRAVKGVRFLLDAVPEVVREIPSARFVLLGRGREEASLRAQVRRVGVEEYVRFAGFRANVAPFYAAMDVAVLTSLSEGLSITLLEAMAHGLPIVATRVGGNPEVVVDGETGFLVPPGDAVALAGRLVHLARDRGLRETMGRAGRRRVETTFDLRLVARRYLDLYAEVACGAR